MKNLQSSKLGTVLSVALLNVLTGCIGYVDDPHHARVYAPAPAVYVEAGVQDEYVYYPGYQVYYSSNRRQYTYQDGHSWVSRSSPPHVSANVLLASPSVRLDFHDAPAAHHATVAQQYPKNWAPPGAGGNPGKEKGNNGKGNGQGNRKND